MNRTIRKEIQHFEQGVLDCFGKIDAYDGLIASEDDVIIDLIHDCTGKAHHLIDAEFHHQTTTTQH